MVSEFDELRWYRRNSIEIVIRGPLYCHGMARRRLAAADDGSPEHLMQRPQ